MQGPPVFMDLALEDQVQELRIYLKDLGAEITVEKSPKGIEDDLHKIIGVCDACFKEGSEPEVEKVLNDIVSIMVVIPLERAENIILAFCEKLTKAPQNRGMVTLRALLLLYQSLHDRSPMRYHVYYALVQIAQTTDQVRAIFRNIDILKSQFVKCPPSIEQLQKLYRLLHEVLVKSGQSEQAAKVMYELLNTYTSENASHARDDAIKCIVTALADPQTFLLDPLLSLKPVRFLEGELIHDLLSIFVSEKLTSYLSFYEKHQNYVTSLLSHDANLKKMRILTFMQMAEQSSELTFEDIERELQVTNEEVESLIVDILKTGLVRCRVDQANRKVFVGSTMHRTFGRAQWGELRELLWQWKLQMAGVQQGMKSVAEAQLELMKH